MSGAMMSNVGNAQIYEANEQRTSAQGSDRPAPFEAGKPNAHNQLDTKDSRSLGNRAAQAEKVERDEEQREAERDHNPLRPAEMHGNEPSRGAKIDKELQEEEEEELRQKGRA